MIYSNKYFTGLSFKISFISHHGVRQPLFLMICDPVKDMVTNRFIQLFREQAVNEGIPVDISYETDTNAPLDQIISRYI